jgi:hypothetical protein
VLYADEEAIAPLWKGKRFPMEACTAPTRRCTARAEQAENGLRFPPHTYNLRSGGVEE